MPEVKKLLVANRGEIATRILQTARELHLPSVALYTATDTSHTSLATWAIPLPSPAHYTSIPHLVSLCREHSIDAVHPGYGFLSESADFAAALEDAGILFVGPPSEILRLTADKTAARRLADGCGVPVVPALVEGFSGSGGGSGSGGSGLSGSSGSSGPAKIKEFAARVGYPIMLKAVDGGGGRGIRLVSGERELEGAYREAGAESASGRVFAEKALVEGFKHVEVQVLGNGREVVHFWERECSVQRRYQKVIETAPSTLRFTGHAALADRIIAAALKMACHVNYTSLGTFEFLARPSTDEFYFMEINPRLQVEHTVTESLTHDDLVARHLQVACLGPDATLPTTSLSTPNPSSTSTSSSPSHPPPGFSIQLRLTAEDPSQKHSLSIGRIRHATFPTGNAIRVDTHIKPGLTVIGPDFDSLLAKIVITSTDPGAAAAKAVRALTELEIRGVTTNRVLLLGVLLSDAFRKGNCDTRWLEGNTEEVLEAGERYLAERVKLDLPGDGAGGSSAPSQALSAGNASTGFNVRKSDKWKVQINGTSHVATVERIKRLDPPELFESRLSLAGSDSVMDIRLERASETDVAGAGAGAGDGAEHRLAEPGEESHLACPVAGTLVEVLVDEGDEVREFDPVAVVRQMKMELEIRAHRAGRVRGLWEVQEGEVVRAGLLVCEIVGVGEEVEGGAVVKGKL